MRAVSLALLAALLVVQGQLWFGATGVGRVVELQRKLDAQVAINASAQTRNDQLTAEVRDLKEGLEMVEEKARSELGMVRSDEILVQYTGRR